jgi:D-sedoheptulose 7-phosphate isomerase
MTVSITAFDGGKLKKIADHSVHVPTNAGEYGPAEDAHLILDHLITHYFQSVLGAD